MLNVMHVNSPFDFSGTGHIPKIKHMLTNLQDRELIFKIPLRVTPAPLNKGESEYFNTFFFKA